MTSDEPGPRLLIAVEPRLFGDALARVLDDDYEVVIANPSTPIAGDANPAHFDLAVISGDDVPAGVSVDRLLRLPAAHTGTGLGTLRTRAGERAVPVGGLAAVAGVLRDALEPTTVGEGK